MPPGTAAVRGPMNELHLAARYGYVERAVAALSNGWIDIDQGDPKGFTAIMFAAVNGHPHIVRVLLLKGANLSIVAGSGAVLHHAVFEGHLGIIEMLVKAGADMEQTSPLGGTPLHMAMVGEKVEVIRALIEAGAKVDSRKFDGETPLYVGAAGGHVDAVVELLRAKPDPMLTTTDPSEIYTPLDVAALNGHPGVVRELVRHFGVEGCGGVSGGVLALCLAAEKRHVHIMAILLQAGVVDTGEALISATTFGGEAPIKLLLQQQPQVGGTRRGGAYVNHINRSNGQTPLVGSILCHSCSPRIVRLLVDAGADTSSPVRLLDEMGEVWFHGTLLANVSRFLRSSVESRGDGVDTTERQLRGLRAIQRFFMTMDAVHAVSWLWPNDAADTPRGAPMATTVSTPLRMMLPILRRRARRPRVLLAALFRPSSHLAPAWTSKAITPEDALATFGKRS